MYDTIIDMLCNSTVHPKQMMNFRDDKPVGFYYERGIQKTTLPNSTLGMSLLAVGKVRAHLSRNFSILPLVHIDPS
jgi:hypothetical protein